MLQHVASAPELANLDPILSASAMVHNVVTNGYSRLITIGRTPEDQNVFIIFPRRGRALGDHRPDDADVPPAGRDHVPQHRARQRPHAHGR